MRRNRLEWYKNHGVRHWTTSWVEQELSTLPNHERRTILRSYMIYDHVKRELIPLWNAITCGLRPSKMDKRLQLDRIHKRKIMMKNRKDDLPLHDDITFGYGFYVSNRDTRSKEEKQKTPQPHYMRIDVWIHGGGGIKQESIPLPGTKIPNRQQIEHKAKLAALKLYTETEVLSRVHSSPH